MIFLDGYTLLTLARSLIPQRNKDSHSCAQPLMAMALISLFACLVSVAALPIEETDTNLIYCNFPVEPEVLANYLNGDKLMPDLYEGKAWVCFLSWQHLLVDGFFIACGALIHLFDTELLQLLPRQVD